MFRTEKSRMLKQIARQGHAPDVACNDPCYATLLRRQCKTAVFDFDDPLQRCRPPRFACQNLRGFLALEIDLRLAGFLDMDASPNEPRNAV